MIVKVLGCSGGIGGKDVRTTSLLVDQDILIDAGTGVGDLSIAELARIDHVFITHSHLDHVCSLPFMVDTVGEMRGKPLVVHASRETEEALKKHLFNWSIWPDFSVIPSAEHAYMRFETIELGQAIAIDNRRITALPALHTVPAFGYQIEGGGDSLVFTGDTTVNEAFWQAVNAIPKLSVLIIETAFPDTQRPLAELSRHLCPSMLAQELKKLAGRPEIFITHLKPGHAEQTMREIAALIGEWQPRMLLPGQCFEFETGREGI